MRVVRPPFLRASRAPVTPVTPVSLCMRGDHFRGQFAPVWGCGEHTKIMIMVSQAPALVIAPTAYTEISGARRRRHAGGGTAAAARRRRMAGR
jgi:hypothetical protein